MENFQVTGYTYTSLKVFEKECMQHLMYYAKEYMSGTNRYNFVMVQL